MRERLWRGPYVILDAATANGYGTGHNANYRDVILDVAPSADPQMVVKVQASSSKEEPDWDAAASPTNQWAYIGVYDLADGTFLAGDTGVVFAVPSPVKRVLINGEARWINVVVSGYVKGSVSVSLSGLSNQ